MSGRGLTTATGINLVAGIWLIIAPFVLGYFGVARTNDMIVGVIVAAIALIGAFTAWERGTWAGWLNVIAGVWLVVAPFVLGYFGNPVNTWNDIILGIIIGGVALLGSGTTTIHRPRAAI